MTLSVIEKTINDSKVLPYDASFIPVTAFDFMAKTRDGHIVFGYKNLIVP